MVPGDISSAAYFIAAGLMVPGSELLMRQRGHQSHPGWDHPRMPGYGRRP
ncbi:MAG: hypothetical protein ACLTBV_16155 [Enterocloster bolteae]